jgi:hypothetical protein
MTSIFKTKMDSQFSKLVQKSFTVLAISTLSLSCFATISSSAQASTGRGVIITPAIIELEADKSQPYDLSVTVQNDSQDDNINLTPILYQFNSVNDDGTPNIKSVDPSSATASWIAFADTQITLNKGEKKDAKIRVQVPEATESGSYYFALTFSQKSQENQAGGEKVSINRQIASLLFLTVKGQVNRNVQLSDIKLSNQTVDPFFDPLDISYKVKLDGNAYVKPSGNIFTGNDLNKPENTLTINPNQRIILPNSSRSFETKINPILDWFSPKVQSSNADVQVAQDYQRPWFGSQKLSFKMIYVNNEGKLDQKTAETQVWFVPWRFILAIAVVVALALGAYFMLKNKKPKAE